MAGRTCDGSDVLVAGEPVMSSTLAEVHEVWTAVSDDSVAARSAANVACTAVAQQWLDVHGLDAELAVFDRFDDLGTLAAIGVRWSVIIGRTQGDPHGDGDSPGDGWKWSARWTQWADRLAAMRRFGGSSASSPGGNVVDFGARKAQHDAAVLAQTLTTGETGPAVW